MGKIFNRAFRETCKLVKVESWGAATVLFVGQGALGLILWAAQHDAAVATRLGTALLPFILFPGIMVWKLITVPAQLLKETEAERDTLREQLNRRADRASALTELAGMNAEISELISRRVQPDQFHSWMTEVDKMLEQLCQVVSDAISVPAAANLIGPSTGPALNFSHACRGHEGHHNGVRQNLAEITRRLHDLIARYDFDNK